MNVINKINPVYYSYNDYKTKLLLNTAICQYTAPVNKTQQSMDMIKNHMILRTSSTLKINGIHHIHLLLTNNTLTETEQWKVRLTKSTNLKYLNVHMLSSNKRSKFSN